MTDTADRPGPFRFSYAGQDHAGAEPERADRRREPQAAHPSSRPILRRQPLHWRDVLLSRPEPDARAATVLISARGEARVFETDRRPTTGELFWAAGGTLYEVDTSLRHASVTFDLPARGDEFAFSAEVDIEWRVAGPERVVRDDIDDVVTALEPTLRREMAMVTRHRQVDQVEDAEHAALAAVSDPRIGDRYGLACTFWVRLSTDKATVDHAGAKRELDHKIELEELNQRLRDLEEEHNQAQLATKVEAYRGYVEGGRLDHAALRLARNPEDVAAVVQLLHDQQVEERRQAIDFVNRLIESDAIDRWQIEEAVGGTLKWLQECVDHMVRSPGTPVTPTKVQNTIVAPDQPTEIEGPSSSS